MDERMNVLVIEDHPELRAMVASVLVECGHTVTECADAASARLAWKRGPYPIVLLDRGLPDTDGDDVLRWLRAAPGGSTAVVIVVTGQIDPEDLRHALDAGADDYLTKPFPLELFKIRLTIAERQVEQRRLRLQAQNALSGSERRYRELYTAASRQAQELAVIDRVRATITRGLEPAAIFQSVVEGIASTFGYTYVSLFLLEGNHLTPHYHVGYLNGLPELPISQGIVGRTVRTGTPVYAPDVSLDPSYIRAEDGVVSEICVPLLDGSRIFGVLNVETTGDQILTERDLALLTAVGDQVGLAITRARLYAEVRGSEERFRALVQHATDIILVLDESGIVRSASPSVHPVLGYDPGDLVGRNNLELAYPDDMPALRRTFRTARLRPNASQRAELRFRHSDGSWRWLEVVATNLLDNPHVAGIVVNARDATERKRTEQELTQALASQQIVNQELERLNRVKSDFVSVVSHEFRTPLTSICGFSELLVTDELTVEQMKEFAGFINGEALRLDRLLGGILDLNRLESGLVTLQRSPVDLATVIEEVVFRASRSAPRHRIVTDLNGDLPPVWADRDKMTQVLTNLVSNAVKYSPDGGVVTVGATVAEGTIHLRISDQGIGIPADSLETIFDRFTRVESDAARKIAGTGLGLAIVRQLVDLHGGRVWAESTPGEGSTFHLLLPVDRRVAGPVVTAGRGGERLLPATGRDTQF
jgi:PAS domain S-box-containing protein